MSECVVRMEMPKSCYDCEIRDNNAYCPICGATLVGYKRSRHEKCPIICQLPKGHGRLVDAEILRAKLIEHIAETNGFVTAFNETQTIVPAERSET